VWAGQPHWQSTTLWKNVGSVVSVAFKMSRDSQQTGARALSLHALYVRPVGRIVRTWAEVVQSRHPKWFNSPGTAGNIYISNDYTYQKY